MRHGYIYLEFNMTIILKNKISLNVFCFKIFNITAVLNNVQCDFITQKLNITGIL